LRFPDAAPSSIDWLMGVTFEMGVVVVVAALPAISWAGTANAASTAAAQAIDLKGIAVGMFSSGGQSCWS
jgi:hypothetical protein